MNSSPPPLTLFLTGKQHNTVPLNATLRVVVLQVLSILGDTFPAVAVYFLDVIVVKIFVGLTFEVRSSRGREVYRI